MKDKIKFPANKISGLEGCLYTLSLIIDAIRSYNISARLPYPFYSLTFDLKTNKVTEWVDDELYEQQTQKILDSLDSGGLEYFEYVKKESFKVAEEFKDYARGFVFDLDSLDDFELVEKYREFMHIYLEAYGLSVITFMYEMIASEKLNELIASRFDNTGEIMHGILPTDYKSFVLHSDARLVEIKNEQSKKKKERLVDEYIRDFFFIAGNYLETPAITKEWVLGMAGEVAITDSDPHTISEGVGAGKIGLTEEEERITKLLQLSEAIRDQRKVVNLIGNYTLFRFADELEERVGLDRELIKRMWWFEFGEFFAKDSNIKNRLKERKEASIVLKDNNLYYLDYFAIEPRKSEIDKDLKGLAASKGEAAGPVKIILGPSQFHKMEKGDILVTENTRPDFVSIMKKAAAIVTEEGGITSHAAIVSRELGIPCVVGVKLVTEILKDGDKVEVNANEGIIKKL